MTSSHLKRLYRFAAGCACAGLLAGCSSEGSDWFSMLKAAREAWDARDAPVSLEQAAAIPYATMGIRINGGREQVLLLATDTNGERLWASGAHVAITTRNGRIVRTAGFGTDLTGYQAAAGDPSGWTRPHSFTWNADFADRGIYSVPVVCRMVPAGPDPITILGKQLDTIRVDESCRAERLDWSFANSYWVSAATGRVWRSIQNVHPNGLTLEIELLRPPLSEG
ncbi:MAG: YjbF family lipoprotein [Rhizomicrobium sp.]